MSSSGQNTTQHPALTQVHEPLCGSELQGLIVVYKKSKLDLYVKDYSSEHIRRLLREKSAAVAQFQAAHDAHQRTLEDVQKICEQTGLKTKTVYRSRLTREMCKGRLVITVGGDGTLLDASRKVFTAPVLGVNSDPRHSIGFLCAAKTFAQQSENDFSALLTQILEDKLKFTAVTRIFGDLDGVPLPHPALNDVLIAHKNPAATTRFSLSRTGENSLQEISFKSSGLWVSAPAGSTAAMSSAGGKPQKIDDHRLQVLVREPYGDAVKNSNLNHFYSTEYQDIKLMSKSREARIYLDGPHKIVAFPLGSQLRLHSRGPKLQLVVTEQMRTRRCQMMNSTLT